jgi:formylglycine-generating enzyme required for sulfatase activity
MKPCGPENESCCLSPVVWGGTYNRGNQAAYPATVSTFRLDRFEVTVGRFRAFVNGFPQNVPKKGAGAHPLILNSGWLSSWSSKLPHDKAALEAMLNSSSGVWTDAPDNQENLPIDWINWYTAFAFCAWDGGRLPTEAEWNYAAAGGGEQRVYPWSNPPSSQTINETYASYGYGLKPVGSTSPNGDGRWRQADLAGNTWEWVLDLYDFSYDKECPDCAKLLPGATTTTDRVLRGGRWYASAEELLTSVRGHEPPGPDVDDWPYGQTMGIRCARQP